MRKLRINHDEKGFTLIELMIVIAIIGILAAIAIPNFIAYRNKSFCSAAESDAKGIAAGLADYFSIPAHTQIPNVLELDGFEFSRANQAGANSGTITEEGGDPDDGITITVTDGSGRCPESYTSRADDWDDTGVYTERITEL